MLHGILVARQNDCLVAPVDVFSYHLVDGWALSDAVPVRCAFEPWCLGDRKLERSSVSSAGRSCRRQQAAKRRSSDSSNSVAALVSSGFRTYTDGITCQNKRLRLGCVPLNDRDRRRSTTLFEATVAGGKFWSGTAWLARRSFDVNMEGGIR